MIQNDRAEALRRRRREIGWVHGERLPPRAMLEDKRAAPNQQTNSIYRLLIRGVAAVIPAESSVIISWKAALSRRR